MRLNEIDEFLFRKHASPLDASLIIYDGHPGGADY